MQATHIPERVQTDLFRANADFFRTAMESTRQLMNLQTRTYASLADRQAQMVSQYLNETATQLMDPRGFSDPYSYFAKQADLMKEFSQRAMDGMVEVAQETVELMAESKDDMNRMMEEMAASAEKSMKEAQANAHEMTNAGLRSVEKSGDRAIKAEEGRSAKARG